MSSGVNRNSANISNTNTNTNKKGRAPVTRSQTRKTRKTTKRAKVDENEENMEIERLEEIKQTLLEGLVFSKDGEYIKLDANLLKRLKPLSEVEQSVKKTNPFEEYPDFMKTVALGSALSLDFIQECSDKMKSEKMGLVMADIIGNLPLDWLALKRSRMLEDNWDYSVKIPVNPKVTNQFRSGRCWAMAGYNVLRYNLIRKLNLDHKFEFSESYLFFYDKIERANMFLEYMWSFRDRQLTDREVRCFTSPSHHFISDGGHFVYFLNLVSKYGLVPKNVYDEGYNSMVSDYLNETLTNVLNHMAFKIFQNSEQWSREDFETRKAEYNARIYDLVVRFLDEPPKPTDVFTWTFKDEHETTHTVPNLTPEKFYRTVVPHEHETKIVIINDPRHEENYYKTSWAPFSVNVQGGLPRSMINLPMDDFKKTICESLKNEDAVWFAADISRCFDPETNTSDTNRFNFKAVLGTDVEFEKSEMLDMLTAVPNHAMCFNGVDTIEDGKGNILGYKKWRVENSWGHDGSLEDAQDHGYFRMSDDYVNKYVYEAVVDLKYFDKAVIEKVMNNINSGDSYTYNPYDVFGDLGSRNSCSHCCKKYGNFVKNTKLKYPIK